LSALRIYREIKYPPKTNTRARKLLSPIFIAASIVSLSLNKFNVSSEYVEKVVKEPRKPIEKNNLAAGDTGVSSDNPQKNPINSEPAVLTPNVPQGNPLPVRF
jgi:hypothetical protein